MKMIGLAIAFALALCSSVQGYGGFATTGGCTGISMVPGSSILIATCPNNAGGTMYNQYNLSSVFSNTNGQLTGLGSGFMSSCTSTSYSNVFLTANCKKADGVTWQWTSINLNKCISRNAQGM